MVVVVAQEELIGHAGDVITDDDVPLFHPRELLINGRHRAGSVHIVVKKLCETLHRAIAVLDDGWMVINVGEKEAFELGVAPCRGRAETGEALRRPTNVIGG